MQFLFCGFTKKVRNVLWQSLLPKLKRIRHCCFGSRGDRSPTANSDYDKLQGSDDEGCTDEAYVSGGNYGGIQDELTITASFGAAAQYGPPHA